MTWEKFRVMVDGRVPDFVFYAPNADAARFFAEMCGFYVLSVKAED